MFFSNYFFKWFYFSTLVFLFGSAFLLIEISLKSFSPIYIAFFRVFIAAFLLYLYSKFCGYSYNFIKRNFKLLFILGLTGTTVPFYLISHAQITINSGETGILIGFMPIFTIIGSHYFFHYEKLNFRKILGFTLGFVGLFILLINNESSVNLYDNIFSKLLVVSAAFFYALNALLVKKLNSIDVIPLSACVMIISSMQLLFILVFTHQDNLDYNTIFYDSVVSLLFMAVFSTAAATVIYYKIIQDYGPSFLSLVNYPIPIFAFFAGVIVLEEKFNFYSIISLCLVVIAIYLSQKD